MPLSVNFMTYVHHSRVTLMFMLTHWANLCLLMADYRCYTWCGGLSLFVSNVSAPIHQVQDDGGSWLLREEG